MTDGGREDFARAIIDWYKDHPTRKYHMTKIMLGKIKLNGRPLTKGEMRSGITFAHRHGCMRRTSNTRWEIVSYKFKKIKKQ